MSTTTKIYTVCKKEFEWTQTGGRPAKRCEDCRPASRANSNGTRHKARVEIEREPDEASEGMSALDVIDSFALDYNLGNTVRFLLERTDGDELENLNNAKVYLERAIARLEAP